jgi:cysteine desulfurase
MGVAVRLARQEMTRRSAHTKALRDFFEAGLRRVPDTVIHGVGSERLPNTSHVAFKGIDNQALLVRLDLAGFAVSAGAACSSGLVEPSGTLLAMGLSRDEAMSAIRVSFGQTNTPAEVAGFLDVLEVEVGELRRLSGVGV